MRIPSYRMHLASGQAIVTIKRRDLYLGPYNSPESKRAYNRIISEYLTVGESFGVKPQDLTIAELLASYAKHCKGYFGTGTSSDWHRIKVALRAVKALYATELAIEFGPIQFRAVRQYILDGKNRSVKATKRPAKLARKYVNALMKRIRRMFRWASGQGLLPPTVHQALADVDPLKEGRTKEARETCDVPPVSEALVEATIPHLAKPVCDMVRLQHLIGARPAEICQITPSIVDRSGEVWEIRLENHKTAWKGKKRTLYVGPKGQAILAPYLEDRKPQEYCFRPCDRVRPRTTPQSCGNRRGRSNTKRKTSRRVGNKYNTGSYGNAIRRACIENGLQHWSPNQLRHSVGTRMQERYDLETAKATLGHANVKTTEIYATADKQRAIKAAKEIG